MMAVHQVRSRGWHPDEVALFETVVERCWAHVERVGAEARLRASEARFRGVFDSKLTGLSVFDARTGETPAINDPFLALTGHTRADFDEGRWEWREFTVPDDLPLDEAAVAQARERGWWKPYEKEYRRLDGGRFSVRISSAPLAGEPDRVVVSIQDISEARAAEAELRRSEVCYRTLTESIDAGFCVVDVRFDAADQPVNYVLVEANPAFERQTGLTDVVGRTALELVPDSELHRFETYGRVARTGEPIRFGNGSEAMGRWFDVLALRVGSPDARRVVILFNHISQRRQTELALRERNESLEQRVAERDRMWETSPDLMLVIDFTGYFRQVNPAWTAVLGYAPEELVGRHVKRS